MSNDINKMDFKQLRKEVQSLRDEIAIMQRKYEDILYNLDTDNFSSRFVKEQGDMRAAIEVTAEGIKTKVSKEDLERYSTIEQTAEHIQNIVSKSAKLDEAEIIQSLAEATDTDKIYCIQKMHGTDLESETYYYFNEITKNWEILSGDSIYTVFNQTEHGFELKGNVKIDGNAVITENLTLSGTVTWDMENSPVKTQFSINGVTWEERGFEDGDVYMKMSFDGGKSWSDTMKVVGEDGASGADASITFKGVNTALGNLFKTWTGGTPTTMTNAYIWTPKVKGGEFYGCMFYAGQGSGYSQMDEGGFSVFDEHGDAKIGIGCYSGEWNYPYMILGVGAGYSADGSGLVCKLGTGLWYGESSILVAGGECPGGTSTVTDISEDYPNATGIFVDFYRDKVWKYIKGVPTEL